MNFAKIKVFGIGGGGCNAVNCMIDEYIKGVEFYVTNTDLSVLKESKIENKILLGEKLTKGLGAGGNPNIGKLAALEEENEIRKAMKNCDMIFLTAGLGGGTGTGATPVFAKIAKELGVLTVAIVTKPFLFEGKKRIKAAEQALQEIKKNIDSIIIINNNNLLKLIGRRPLIETFCVANNILRQGIRTITDLIAMPALINIDFADIKTIMSNKGGALIGIGLGEGEDKALNAARKAIQSPLLETKINGASDAIVNITGGKNLTLFDTQTIVIEIQKQCGKVLDIIFGVAINENLDDAIIVTIIATGFSGE